MYRPLYPRSYEEKAGKLLRRHPELRGQYAKTLQLLELNPFHPSLRLHKFKTKLFEGYSVYINLSYRISLEFLVTETDILLVDIGNHRDIYGRE